MNPPASTLGDGCFLTGTLISVVTAVGRREQPVESLRPGETVTTAAGEREVRAVDVLTPSPPPGASVRIMPNALGPGRPRESLTVTPEQLLFVQDDHLPDGALVPAGSLVNGRSIQRATGPSEGSEWHCIGLASHGLLLVHNLLVSSRRRSGEALCTRLLPPGPGLFALRGRLSRMATSATPPPDTAAAPTVPPPAAPPTVALTFEDLPLLLQVADDIVRPAAAPDGLHFTIPPGAETLRLRSPLGTLSAQDTADADQRVFGVAIQSVMLDGIPLDLGGIIAGDGFHALEVREHQRWRWTNGNAELRLPPCRQPRCLTVAINDWHKLLHPKP